MSSFGLSPTLEQDDSDRGLSFRVSYGFLAGVLLAGTFRTQVTRLEVTAGGLMAMGYLGGYKPGMLRMDWPRVRELHFAPAGKGEVGGLHVREGEWCSRCILPRIDEAQCDQVMATILERFPQAAGAAVRTPTRPAARLGLQAVPARPYAPAWQTPAPDPDDKGRLVQSR